MKQEETAYATAYYTPISEDGRLVEKRIDAIEVLHEGAAPAVVVRYTLSNPYDYPITVPIQSGLPILYEHAKDDQQPGEPELHVIPATVRHRTNGDLLYAADDAEGIFAATAVLRRHVGTGIPNYQHPVSVSVTLVPGDTAALEATAAVPERVKRMILVDTMVGPDRPYGLYPQLLAGSSVSSRRPQALRLYVGAVFQSDPPYVRLPAPENGTERPSLLQSLMPRQRYAKLMDSLQRGGRLRNCSIGFAAVILALSQYLRASLRGEPDGSPVSLVRIAVIGLLAGGLVAGSRIAAYGLAFTLVASAVYSLVRLGWSLAEGFLTTDALLTEAAIIPILFLVGAVTILRSPPVRRNAAGLRKRE